MEKPIVVIGGGPAGVEAALAVARRGKHVLLVHEGGLGGRATWQTLLPARLWLQAAGSVCQPQTTVDVAVLREKHLRAAESWPAQMAAKLRGAGVEARLGAATFQSPHHVSITPPGADGDSQETVEFSAAIIATGSIPYTPPGIKTDGGRVLAPHQVIDLERMPESMIIVGAGGPAVEYVDIFSRLGVDLTWITGPVGVLPAFPPDAGQYVAEVFAERGVQLVQGLLARETLVTDHGVQVATVGGLSYEAEVAIVSIGHRPDLARLNLEAAGLRSGSSASLPVDGFGRTAVPHIYLVGDAAIPLAVNASQAQGRVAGLHAAGGSPEPVSMESVVLAVYSRPEVAVVGRMSDPFVEFQSARVSFQETLEGHLAGKEGEGFLHLVWEPNRRVVGAFAVGPAASQVLAPVAVAIRMKATIDDLAQVYAAHPSYGELAFLAARSRA